MKRVAFLMASIALAGAGCVTLPGLGEEAKPMLPPPVEQVAPPPPILPGQVTEGNAAQTIEALREELDRASAEGMPGPNP